MKHDPRITPCRDGIAARSLEGILEAEVYLDPKAMSCTVAATAIRSAPDANAEQMDQLLFGERFEVLEEEGGWLFGQAARDVVPLRGEVIQTGLSVVVAVRAVRAGRVVPGDA